MSGTAWNVFTNDTGDKTKVINADRVMENFAWSNQHICPQNSGTKTGSTYNLGHDGSSIFAFKALYLDNGGTDEGAIYWNAGSTYFIKSLAGVFTFGGFSKITAPMQIESTLATGTSPLAVSSTTVNTNLNADYVDGYHSTSLWRHPGEISAAKTPSEIVTYATDNTYYVSFVNNGGASYPSVYGSIFGFSRSDGPYQYMWQIFADQADAGQLYFRHSKNDNTWQAWGKIWTSENDGSGSGLDADTLDARHATGFHWKIADIAAAKIPSEILALASDNGFYSVLIATGGASYPETVGTIIGYCNDDGPYAYDYQVFHGNASYGLAMRTANGASAWNSWKNFVFQSDAISCGQLDVAGTLEVTDGAPNKMKFLSGSKAGIANVATTVITISLTNGYGCYVMFTWQGIQDAADYFTQSGYGIVARRNAGAMATLQSSWHSGSSCAPVITFGTSGNDAIIQINHGSVTTCTATWQMLIFGQYTSITES